MSDSQVDFKIGDVVKIKAGTEHYGQDRSYNPADVLGVVVNVKTPDEEGYKYNVRWNTNCSNVYRPKDLELAVSAVEPTKEDTQADSSELEEAYAKIDTLESALEDAVKELISLRERNSAAVIDVNQGEFKPIKEMTLQDWVEALDGEWQFLLSDGQTDSLNEIDYTACGYPVGMKMSGWKTLDGFDTYNPEYRDDYDVNIIKRIK